MTSIPLSITRIAEIMGGDVTGGQAQVPGPGHSAADRSLSIKLDSDAPDGFICHSFAGDDDLVCKDYVRKKLGLPVVSEKKPEKGSPWKNYSPAVARYTYRQADGTPYLQVNRTAAKDFYQYHWNGETWLKGKPKGPKIPYMADKLTKAPATTPVYVVEGEKDADNLAKIGFVATCNSEGADDGTGGKWTSDLNQHFKDRDVFIIPDNDAKGRKHANYVASCLDRIAKSVRIVELPDIEHKGDVSDWLKTDPTGAKLVQLAKAAPQWEPGALPPRADEDVINELAGLSTLEYAKRRESLADEIGIRVTDLDKLFKEAHGENKEVKKKQADILIELASSVELFRDVDDTAYARFEVGNHKQVWPLRSKGFKRWLTRKYYESTNGAPNSDAMQAALGVLEAKAQFDAPEHEVHVRVAGLGDRIYLDLADKDWRAIEIDKGGWRIVQNPPVYFRRSSGMKSLPEPVRNNGKAGTVLNDDLRPLLNVRDDKEFMLDVAWLLAALRPSGPYPVNALAGEQGGGKSTRQRVMRALVDPNSVPLRALPRSEHDLYIAARNSHVLAYDNASGLPDWLSDAFCRLSTGGGFSTRELYSDQDEVLFWGQRPLLLNGIDDTVTKGDLAQRAIVQAASEITDKQRKQESEFWPEFERRRPRILGALLDAVSHGLKTLPTVMLDRKPRMADFAVWVTACEGALWKEGAFMATYASNIKEAVEVVLDNDELADVLRKYFDQTLEFVDTTGEKLKFKGTATDLLAALNKIATEAQQRAKGWPKRAADLSKFLRRLAPPLRKIGINVTIPDRKNKGRSIIIAPAKVGKTLSPLSPLSLPNGDNDLDGDSNDDVAVTDAGAAVTIEEPAIAGDSKNSDGDSNKNAAVTANPLKNKKSDGSDGSDSISPTLAEGRYRVLDDCPPGTACLRCHETGDVKTITDATKVGSKTEPLHEACAPAWFDGDHVCAQCHGTPDGKERLVDFGNETVLLHPECEGPYRRRRKAEDGGSDPNALIG